VITNVRLQHFRSYNDDSFEFDPGVNIIVGPNASGKTNLLEAILMITRGKSYRATDQELITHTQPWARIDADIGKEHRVVKIEQQADTTKKSFEVDGKQSFRLGSTKVIPTVLFEPNHLGMLAGSPEHRRVFIDDLIEQTVPGYGTVLRNYKRALAQRNRLLKNGTQAASEQLFAWDVRLSDLGSNIVSRRFTMLETINQNLSTIYSELAKQPSTAKIVYSNEVDPPQYASFLLKKLEKNRELDVMRGFTSAGPHREDLIIYLNNQLLAQTASRGESRTALLALKIIELQIIERARDQKPILLLDDVFSELDGSRRKALTEHIKHYQTFITTTDADVIGKLYAQKATLITLGNN
jgi:DNA replication and repair protein RecF